MNDDPLPEAQVVDRYFAGDRALYLAYDAACRAQFRLDVVAGDAACSAGDLAALERLGHILKPVLLSLGHGRLAGLAAELERDANAQHAARTVADWHALRAGVEALLQCTDGARSAP